MNNAGIFDIGGSKRSLTADGHEAHFGTNYLAPALLTLLLLPHLQQAPKPRVVFVSSKLHQLGSIDWRDPSFGLGRRYTSTAAYSQSKLAEVVLCRELERRAEWLRCVSVHPGNVVTDVVRTLPALVQKAYRIVMGALLLTPAQGARSAVYAAVAEAVAELPRPGPYLESACKPVPHCPQAIDALAGEQLWAETLKLLDVREESLAGLVSGSPSKE